MIWQMAKRYSGEIRYLVAASSTPVVALLVSLVVTRFVPPDEMGTVQSMFLIVPYAGLLQLGVFSGLNRNLAFYSGRGDADRAQQMVDASGGYARWLSMVGLVIGLGMLAYALTVCSADKLSVAAALGLCVLLMLVPWIQHIDTTFRSGRQFARLGNVLAIETLIFAASAVFPWILSGLGKVIQDVVRYVSGFALRWRAQPYPIRGPVQKTALMELIQIGFPIALTGYLWTMLSVADQSVIAISMGPEELGHYTLARLAATLLAIVPQTVGTILYPKASAAFGRCGTASALRKYVWISMGLTAAVVTPVCVLGWLLAEPATLRLLPRYAPGIRAAQITSAGGIAWVFLAPGILINVLRRNTLQLVAVAVALAAMWLLGISAVRRGADIANIAALRVGCSAALGMFTTGFCLWLTRNVLADRIKIASRRET